MSTVQNQSHKKHTTLEKGSSSRSANIVCYHYKGMGHVMKDCPSACAFIAAPDGNGYVSASDVEDDLVLAANVVADLEDDEGEEIDSIAITANLPSLLVQRVLSSKRNMGMRRSSNARICSICFSKSRIALCSP